MFLKYATIFCILCLGPKQREKFKHACPWTLGLFSMTTLDINIHKNIHVADTRIIGSRMTGLLLPLSNSYRAHANIAQHLLEVSALYR